MKLIHIILLLFTLFGYSQKKVKVKTGNLNTLKDVNEYNIIFDYSDLEIVNYKSEENFLEEKVALREDIKVGKGEKFKKDWFAFRTELYEPYFIDYFNSYFKIKKKRKIIISKNNNAKYTIIVKSKMLYPGYNVVVAWESAKLWVEYVIYETENPENIIITTKQVKEYRGYHHMKLGIRVANSYGFMAEKLAKFLKNKT